jgi:hypothetical protein
VSIKVMDWVFEHSPHGGGTLLVLLGIADFAHEDGSGAFPSVETLARKARLSKRQTQSILKSLADSGELLVSRGGGRRKSNTYTIVMEPRVASQPVNTNTQLDQPSSDKKGEEIAPFYAKGEVDDNDERDMRYENDEVDSAETMMPASPEPLEETSLESLPDIEPSLSPTGTAFKDLSDSTEIDWRERMLRETGRRNQVMVLMDMVEIHDRQTHEPNMGGRAAALLLAAKDPARAVALAWAALNNRQRTGDVFRYALGILKGSDSKTVKSGGGEYAQTMTASDLVAAYRIDEEVAE